MRGVGTTGRNAANSAAEASKAAGQGAPGRGFMSGLATQVRSAANQAAAAAAANAAGAAAAKGVGGGAAGSGFMNGLATQVRNAVKHTVPVSKEPGRGVAAPGLVGKSVIAVGTHTVTINHMDVTAITITLNDGTQVLAMASAHGLDISKPGALLVIDGQGCRYFTL